MISESQEVPSHILFGYSNKQVHAAFIALQEYFRQYLKVL